jgi:hypothetical protein
MVTKGDEAPAEASHGWPRRSGTTRADEISERSEGHFTPKKRNRLVGMTPVVFPALTCLSR